MDSEADASTAGLLRTGGAEGSHLSIAVDLVVLQHSELDVLVLVVLLLGLGVGLLLSLLGTTVEAKDKVKGGLLLDVVVLKGAAVLQLLAGEDQALLVRGDALLVLDLLLDVLDSVGGLNLQSNSLASERLHKNLHFRSAN